MSVFAIYAFVVTGLYILYMSVAVCMDLFGKKGQKKDGAEEIITDDMVGVDDDDSTFVDETDGGYSTSRGGTQDPAGQDDGHSDAGDGDSVVTEPDNGVLEDPDTGDVESSDMSDSGHVNNPKSGDGGGDAGDGEDFDDGGDYPQRPLDDAEILYYENQNNMEDLESILAAQAEFINAVPVYQDEYRSDDFALVMAQPMCRKSRILRKVVGNNNS